VDWDWAASPRDAFFVRANGPVFQNLWQPAERIETTAFEFKIIGEHSFPPMTGIRRALGTRMIILAPFNSTMHEFHRHAMLSLRNVLGILRICSHGMRENKNNSVFNFFSISIRFFATLSLAGDAHSKCLARSYRGCHDIVVKHSCLYAHLISEPTSLAA
jgi:hypothetical protein